MVLLTYRTDELHRRHALRPLLAELERLDLVRRDRADAVRSRRARPRRSPTSSVTSPARSSSSALFARSEGNALYTEELLAAGLDGRGAAPQSLRDAFLLRIERLGPETRRAVRAVAVGAACSTSRRSPS